MAMQEFTYGCKFCGQIRMIVAGENITEQELEKLAVLACNCEEAQYIQKVEQKKTFAEANIKELFEGDGQLCADLLQVVDALATMRIRKLTVTNADGVRAALTAKENSIKVERTRIKKETRED